MPFNWVSFLGTYRCGTRLDSVVPPSVREASMSPAFQHLPIGFPFLNGKGFKRDDVYAHMWSHIAVSREDETAKKSRDIVTGEMTPS